MKSSAAPPETSETFRTVVSLLLFMHLFCVAVMLAGNLAPSPLQLRLAQFLAPYTLLLNLDPDGTAFHLTHGGFHDVDHRVEVLPAGADAGVDEQWQVLLPGDRARGGLAYLRQQYLADRLAQLGSEQGGMLDEQMSSVLARGIARHAVLGRKMSIEQLRSRRHLLQAPESLSSPVAAERDPFSSFYFGELYRASVIVQGNQVDILKRADSSQETAVEQAP